MKKKLKKKIVATVLTLALALSMVACGGNAPAAEESAESESAAPTAEESAESKTEVVEMTEEVGSVTADSELSCDLTGRTFAFIHQGLETEFWAEAVNWSLKNLKAAGAEVIEYNAEEDVNKSLEMVNDAIAQGVDAILAVPQDSDSAVSLARAANEADIPIAFPNRIPSDMESVDAIACQADNEAIAQGVMEFCLEQAIAKYGKVNVIHMMGDLGDTNAVARIQGFDNAMEKYKDQIGEVYQVTTNWDANTALANLQTVLQTTTDIQVLCCGSDFLYPQIESALDEVGLWNKVTEDNHVYMCAVDGDSGAAALMDAGYVDGTGVQDVYNECRLCIEALAEAVEKGQTDVNKLLTDSGVAQTTESMKENRHAMWGFQVLDAKK